MRPDLLHSSWRQQLEELVDEHRDALDHSLDGLTEEEARRRLVPSKTTLFGLLKHAIFVEQVWFDEAITCRSRSSIGAAAGPDESFDLCDQDTIASVRANYLEVCARSRTNAATVTLDDVVHGNRRGALPMRWVYLHVISELAQHRGHADILREQILSDRT